MSAANDESRQVLPSRVIWDGSIDRFEVSRTVLKVIMDQLAQATFLMLVFRLLT
jgi:hypothetical protein